MTISRKSFLCWEFLRIVIFVTCSCIDKRVISIDDIFKPPRFATRLFGLAHPFPHAHWDQFRFLGNCPPTPPLS